MEVEIEAASLMEAALHLGLAIPETHNDRARDLLASVQPWSCTGDDGSVDWEWERGELLVMLTQYTDGTAEGYFRDGEGVRVNVLRALEGLDGSREARVAMLSGLSRERIRELGGVEE